MPLPPPPPPGWGKDKLSAFFDEARSNQYATFVHKKATVDRLMAIDDAFWTIVTGWTNPKDPMAAMFMLRSHSAFRAACSMAMAGQAVEAFSALRACLETAGYALLVNGQPGTTKVWMDRHDDEASMKAAKSTFTQTNVRAAIVAKDRALAPKYDRLYQTCIDFGGHPNVLGVTGSMTLEDRDGDKLFQSIYLHGDGLTLDNALISVARVGVCSLLIFQEIFQPRFTLLGVEARMPQLKAWL